MSQPPIYLRYLHSEVSAGLALLDLAQAVHALPIASQCRRNAEQSYETALRFLEQVAISEAERTELSKTLASLEARLTHPDAP